MSSNHLMIKVSCRDPQTNTEVCPSFVLNHAAHEGRERLARFQGWAHNRRYAVTTEPAPERPN